MRHRVAALAALVGLSLALSFAPTYAGPASASREMDADGARRLAITLPMGGSLRVTGTAGDRLSVAPERGKADGSVPYSFRRRGDVVELHPNASSALRPLALVVGVPRRFDVEIESAGGDVALEELDGELLVQTAGGDIEVQDCTGTLRVQTAGGDVDVKGGRLDGSVETAGGNIAIRDVDGSLHTQSVGGDVVVAGGRSEERLRLQGMGGDLEVLQPNRGVTASWAGGEVLVQESDGDVDLAIRGGEATIAGVRGDIDVEMVGGMMDVVVPEDGANARDLRVAMIGGAVEVQIPAGFPVSVDVVLSRSRSSRNEHDLESDLPLDIERDRDWVYVDGEPYRRTRGRAVVGEGTHRLRIDAQDADVSIVIMP